MSTRSLGSVEVRLWCFFVESPTKSTFVVDDLSVIITYLSLIGGFKHCFFSISYMG